MSRKERKEAARRDKKKLKEKRARNKEFARVTYFFVALFLVMMGYIVYFQVKESRDVIRSPYNARQDSYATGSCGETSQTEREGAGPFGKFSRTARKYGNILTGSDFAHVVGYSSRESPDWNQR